MKEKNLEYTRQKDKLQNNVGKYIQITMLNIEFIIKLEAKGKKKVITKKFYQKYKKFIKQDK